MSCESEIDDLIENLKARNRAARDESRRRLQLYGEIAVPKIGRLLMESSGVVAEIAALTLSEIGIPAIPTLVKVLREGGHDRRKHASTALAHIGTAAIPALEEATTDEDGAVRWRAFNALARIGAPSVPFIVARLLEGDEETRLRILGAVEAQLAFPDAPPVDQWDAERNSVIPCLVQLVEHPDPALLQFGNGMLQKVGLPSVSLLAEHILKCRNVVAEANCVSALCSLVHGFFKQSEVAGDIIVGYTASLFQKALHVGVRGVDLSTEDYRQGLNSGELRVWGERLHNEYLNLFTGLGILAVPVIAPAWLNGTKEEKAFSHNAMRAAFGGWFYFPHIPFANPRNYQGPTSPDDRIFSEADPEAMEDVDKIVSALEYKSEKTVHGMPKRMVTEHSSSTKDSLPSEMQTRSKTLDLVRERAIEAIRDKGVMMLPSIIEIAESGDDDRCLCALEAISVIDGIDLGILSNNPGLVPTLIRFMKIPHDWYRIRAIAIAEHIGEPLLPFLSERVSDAYDELDRLSAIAVMGSIGRAACSHIEEFVPDADTAVAAFARWHLARIAAGQ